MMYNEKAGVLVFGAQHPTGLMTARSLRGLGVDIIGIAFGESPCLRSSVWSSILITERTSEAVMHAVLTTAAARTGRLLLLPADDDCVKILSDRRHELPSSCILIMPDVETVDLLLDKSKFFCWAEAHGFPLPKTIEVTGFDQLDNAIREIGYPVLLKPLYRSWLWNNEIPNDKVFILESHKQYEQLPQRLFDVAPTMLVQQWIPGGDDEVYFCLVQYSSEGKLANYFSGRKLMQWPPLGGSTAIAVSDELDETRDITVAIFDSVKYQGLGSMEYKKDPRNGKFYIMEPTVGRNDFQSYVAVTGGVNLTRATCRELLGEVAEKTRKRPSVWFCETSAGYGLKYYLRRKDYYFMKHLALLFRKPGFAYFSLSDTKPFIELLRNRFGKPVH